MARLECVRQCVPRACVRACVRVCVCVCVCVHWHSTEWTDTWTCKCYSSGHEVYSVHTRARALVRTHAFSYHLMIANRRAKGGYCLQMLDFFCCFIHPHHMRARTHTTHTHTHTQRHTHTHTVAHTHTHTLTHTHTGSLSHFSLRHGLSQTRVCVCVGGCVSVCVCARARALGMDCCYWYCYCCGVL